MKQTKSRKNRESEIALKEELLVKVEQDCKYLRQVNKRLKEIDKSYEDLTAYYFGEWLDDYNHASTEKPYKILNQDSIHEALQEIYCEKVKILKQIVRKIEG